MIIIDNITAILSVVLLIVVLFASVMTPFARKPKIQVPLTEDFDGSPSLTPSVSIIFVPHNNAEELERNLDAYLSQEYPELFEIIVVVSKGDMQTEDILKHYKDKKNLYTTFIPDSSRYMSRKKLAITLGVKAAKNEWILLADITCYPSSNQWLKAVTRHCDENHNLVVGYTRYDEDTADFRRFERLHTSLYLMREDQKGHAYRCNSNALMFRKSDFMREEGFRDNLKYLRGEYDFIVNKHASRHSLAMENSADGTLTEMNPIDKEWRNKKLFYMESRKHLKGSFRHRLLPTIDQIVLHLSLLAVIGTASYSVFVQNWVLTGVAGFLLMLLITIHTAFATNTMHAFGETIPAWKIFVYELRVVWHHLNVRWKYLRADKYDFISHKL